MSKTINIAEDYTQFPGGRYVEDGEGNGTTFREKILKPALEEHPEAIVEIILDGAAGYPSSFLEEAFGGLVRVNGFSSQELLERLEFKADAPGFSRYIELIQQYVKNAKPKAG